ncbi:MAG: sulfate transporter [Cyanobium sp. CACIAM 14]|nr:MAG: sulfate transporter [Cyanobium sp. CACIAM 14]
MEPGEGLARVMPGLGRLLGYQRDWLRPDLLAGLTVGAYLIPQCMAYAEVAGLPAITGLWAILPPLLLYALLGSSPQLAVGPESTTAVMTAAVIGPMAAGDPASYAGFGSLLALLVGLVGLAGAAARLGFVADLLSKPILVGYLGGVALIMIASQLGRICGLTLAAGSVPGQLRELSGRLADVHGPTLGLALGVLAFLLLVQRLFPRAPGPLLAVLLAMAVVAAMHLEQRGVAVIGALPAGLPHPVMPPAVTPGQLRHLLTAAVGIALVGYSDNVLTARAFAARGDDRIDANQELLALGAVNLGNGLMQGFPVSSSGSRTAIGDSLGSRSQLYSLVAFLVVLAVLLALRPLLALFPKAALGAIVIYAALRLVDIPEFLRLRQFRPSEFRLAVVTLLGVLFTDLLTGVALAMGLSVLDLFARLVRPHDAVMGLVGEPGEWHDLEDWPEARTLPGLVLFRFDAPLCFANADHFRQRVLATVAAEPQPVRWFVLNAEAIVEIDSTAADALDQLLGELASREIRFGLVHLKADLRALLQRSGLVERIGAPMIFTSLSGAVAAFEARPAPAGS